MLGSRDRTLESISMRRLFASATILSVLLTNFGISPASANACTPNITAGVVTGTSGTGCTSLVISDGTATSIEDEAFEDQEDLVELRIGEGVTTIGDDAFAGATSLTTLTLPNSLTRIKEYAFSGASSLTSLTLPNSLTTIDEYAFEGLTSLTSLTIPNSVTIVGDSAFTGATSLTSLTIGTGVSQMGMYAFLDATSLTSVIIPNSITGIDIGTFMRASSLANVTIGNGVSTIDIRAFQNASSLTRVTFLGAAPTVRLEGDNSNSAFLGVSAGAKAIVTSANAASFGVAGSNWNGLIVEIAASDAPASDDGAAAARVAAELREAKKRKARADLTNSAIALTVGAFSDAECNGVHGVNFAEVSAEIQSLSLDSRIEIKEILKICRKYEVVDKVATSKPFHHAMLQEIGLIPLDSKFKSQITVALRSLPAAEVSTYKQIEIAIANKVKAIQDLKNRLAATIARISGR